MEASELKKEIIERINEIEDEKQLLRIEIMIENLLASAAKTDFWDELPETIKQEIVEAEKEAEAGLLIPHEEVMRKIKARYNIS